MTCPAVATPISGGGWPMAAGTPNIDRPKFDAIKHPALSIDQADAAETVRASLTGDGPYWDQAALIQKPELATAGPTHVLNVLETCFDGGTTDFDIDPKSDLGRRTIAEWCQERAASSVAILESIPVVDGQVRAHRLIAASPETLRPNLGIYWTHDFLNWEDAYAPWSENGPESDTLLIEAQIPLAAIDWQTSCIAQMDWYSGEAESELRLFPGHPLRILSSVWLDSDKPAPLPDLDWHS